MHALVKALFCQSLLGTRAGLPTRARWYIHTGKAISIKMLNASSDAVSGDEIEVRSALTML